MRLEHGKTHTDLLLTRRLLVQWLRTDGVEVGIHYVGHILYVSLFVRQIVIVHTKYDLY